MNTVYFHVQEVLSEPEVRHCEWGTYIKLLVRYSDDGGSGQTKYLTFKTLDEARAVSAGYTGQH